MFASISLCHESLRPSRCCLQALSQCVYAQQLARVTAVLVESIHVCYRALRPHFRPRPSLRPHFRPRPSVAAPSLLAGPRAAAARADGVGAPGCRRRAPRAPPAAPRHRRPRRCERKMAAPRPPARRSGVALTAPTQDLEALRALTALFKEPRNRETAPRTIFQRVLDILKKSSRAVELACRDPAQVQNVASSLQLITECFRCLRNACIECSLNQNTLRNLNMIGLAVDLVLLFRELRVEQEALLTAFRCGLQFLGNVASRNADSQTVLWMHAFPELFLSCLNHPDRKIVSYSSMILFTALNAERLKDLEENLNIAIDVVDAHRRQPESEWPYLVISEHFLRSPDMVQTLYAKMSNPERVTLLDVLISKVSSDEPPLREDIPVFLSHAELLASMFMEQCETVLKLTSEQQADDDEEVLATIRLLDVLCEMSTNTELLSYLQVFPGLLESVIGLLRLVHAAGTDSTNIFSTASSIRADGDVASMAEGFRSHLIRLIGNLCYKDKKNQDKVNELDGIPLILDSCKPDDRNPFLAQWAVYAIRNLTEGNSQNQDLIAKMEEQGLVDMGVLRKMGFEVEKRGDRLILKPTERSAHGE